MASCETCVSCHGPLRRPKLLSCLHSVCSACVGHIAPSAASVSCPKCLEVTQWSAGVFVLPDDLLTATPSADIGQPTEMKPCDECGEERTATSFCVDCGEHLCELHAKVHPISTRTMNHCVRLVSECEGETRKPASRCALHPQRVLSLYCLDCWEAFCPTCQEAGAHGGDGHNMLSAEAAASQQREAIRRLLSETTNEGRGSTLSTAVSEVTEMINSLNSSAERVSAQISERINALVALLRRQETDLLDKLEAARWEKLQALQTQLDDLEKRHLSLERSSRMSMVAIDTEQVRNEAFLVVSRWLRDALQKAVSFKYEGVCQDSFLSFVQNDDAIANAIGDGVGFINSKVVDSSKSVVCFTATNICCGEDATISLDVKDLKGVPLLESADELGLKIRVTEPDGQPCTLHTDTPASSESSRQLLRFTPKVSGHYQLSVVTGNDENISGSPLSLDVSPAKVWFASNTCQSVSIATSDTYLPAEEVCLRGTMLKDDLKIKVSATTSVHCNCSYDYDYDSCNYSVNGKITLSLSESHCTPTPDDDS